MDIKNVKRYIAESIPIKYEGITYTVTACILRIYKGKWYYQLELKNGNYVVIVDMERVNDERSND